MGGHRAAVRVVLPSSGPSAGAKGWKRSTTRPLWRTEGSLPLPWFPLTEANLRRVVQRYATLGRLYSGIVRSVTASHKKAPAPTTGWGGGWSLLHAANDPEVARHLQTMQKRVVRGIRQYPQMARIVSQPSAAQRAPGRPFQGSRGARRACSVLAAPHDAPWPQRPAGRPRQS